jgi:hypothetical protein
VLRERIVGWSLTVSLGALSMLAAHCGGYHLTHALARPADGQHMAHPAHGDHAAGVHQVEHGHLLPVASGSFIAVVLACLAAAIVMRRSRCCPPIHLRGLVAAQLVAFAAVEVLQRVVSDAPAAALTDLDALLALALQLPVAVVVYRLCRRAVAAVARLLGSREAPAPTRAPAPIAGPVTVHRPPKLHWMLAAGRRGPPTRRLVHI